jgi:signal transduction histidine kinase
VARNAWKYVAELVLDLDPALPEVRCQLGKLNQVMLNLILNAARAIGEAIGDTTGGAPKGTITIATRRVEDWVEIRISDTGAGIPEAARARLFDPFPTPAQATRSTGRVLACCRDVIVSEHGGVLTFETQEGTGTTFVIRLPLR